MSQYWYWKCPTIGLAFLSKKNTNTCIKFATKLQEICTLQAGLQKPSHTYCSIVKITRFVFILSGCFHWMCWTLIYFFVLQHHSVLLFQIFWCQITSLWVTLEPLVCLFVSQCPLFWFFSRFLLVFFWECLMFLFLAFAVRFFFRLFFLSFVVFLEGRTIFQGSISCVFSTIFRPRKRRI